MDNPVIHSILEEEAQAQLQIQAAREKAQTLIRETRERLKQEGEKAPVPGALEPSGQVGEGQQVLPPLLPAGHGGEDLQEVKAAVEVPEDGPAVGFGGGEAEGL